MYVNLGFHGSRMDLLRAGSTDEAPHEGCWDEAKEREKKKKERGGERGRRRRRAPFVFSTWRISETQALHRVQYYLTYSDLLSPGWITRTEAGGVW